MIPLLLLACGGAETADSGPPSLQERPPAWSSLELLCVNGAVSLSADSAGQASAAFWVLAPTERPLTLIDSDGAGTWQAWRLSFSLEEELPCESLTGWRVELRDAQGALLDCWDEDAQPC